MPSTAREIGTLMHAIHVSFLCAITIMWAATYGLTDKYTFEFVILFMSFWNVAFNIGLMVVFGFMYKLRKMGHI